MPASTRFPLLRRSLLVLAFLGLVGLFFALNLFLYIPRQQLQYNKKVFRILKEIAQDFTKTIEGNATTAVKNLGKTSTVGRLRIAPADTSTGSLQRRLMQSYRELDITEDLSRNFVRTYRFERDTISVSFSDSTKPMAPVQVIKIPIAKVLNPNVQNLHKDLFDLVMLVKRTETPGKDNGKAIIRDTVVYKNGQLATRYMFAGDSVFRNMHYGQFSTVNDIEIEGAGYKAFSLPFQIGREELVLIGFLPDRIYRNETTRYSKPTLLWICAFLVLILLSLPVIKLLLSGRHERVTVNETRMLIVVFVTTPFLVMLAAGASMIYQYADAASDKTLRALHNRVQAAFKNEISLVLDQLRKYDSLTAGLETSDSLLQKAKIGLAQNGAPVEDAKDILYYPTVYKNVDDIYWTDSAGKQIAKWFFIREPVTYLDVSERDFYTRLRHNQGYIRKSPERTDTFYVEPTVSWSTGAYSVNIVTRSNTIFTGNKPRQSFLIGMATRLYSMCNPVVPKDFSFCITDHKGTILFHSETERCLHENLLDEASHHPQLTAALGKKERVLIDDIRVFDREAKMVLSPVQGMPEMYLVTYYNKRAQNLFVFHITAFAFLCTAGMLVCLLLFHLLKSLCLRKSDQNVFRYETEWMRPSGQKSSFYRQVLAQQFYIAFFLALGYLAVSLADAQPENFLLEACLLIPFMITFNYFLVKRRLEATPQAGNLQSDKKEWRQNRNRLLIFYAISIGVLLVTIIQLLYGTVALHAADWLMISLIVLTPLLAFVNLPVPSLLRRWEATTFFGKYLILLLSCIMLITALPTIGFLWYALNQEKLISTKSEQFAAAKTIEKRRLQLNQYAATTRLNENESRYLHERKLYKKYGIYLPNQYLREIQLDFDPADTCKKDISPNANFYKAATRFLFLPRDHSDYFDNNPNYYWRSSPLTNLVYANFTDQVTPASIYLEARRNTGPGVFRPFANLYTWLLLLGVLIFFIWHTLLIRSIARKIFLMGYISRVSESQQDKAWPDPFYKGIRFSRAEMEYYKVESPFITQCAIGKIEASIKQGIINDRTALLHLQHKLAKAYTQIWQTLQEDEQFVLYDFAIDGFTNYRNVDVVYALFLKGLIVRREDGHLETMSYSFRSFLLSKSATEEIISLEQKNNTGSSWKNTRNILYALFFATMIFLFATQQDLSNKIIAIVSGLATLVPLLIRLFDRSLTGGGTNKS